MNIKNEILYDFDIRGPKATVTDRCAVLEHVRRVVMISDTEITCQTDRFFVSVFGTGLTIGEIWEGRIELAGKVRGLEIFTSPSKD